MTLEMMRDVSQVKMLIRAWREHLKLTQDEVAVRLGISQPAYAQQEIVARPRRATREKIAAAFGVKVQQLEL